MNNNVGENVKACSKCFTINPNVKKEASSRHAIPVLVEVWSWGALSLALFMKSEMARSSFLP